MTPCRLLLVDHAVELRAVQRRQVRQRHRLAGADDAADGRPVDHVAGDFNRVDLPGLGREEDRHGHLRRGRRILGVHRGVGHAEGVDRGPAFEPVVRSAEGPAERSRREEAVDRGRV